MKIFLKMTWTEFKLNLREPLSTFFTLVFPLLLLVVFGSIYGNEPDEFLGGYGSVDVSVPGYIGMIVGTIGMLGLPLTLANYRDQGILRRLRATPVKPGQILWSQVAVNVVMTVVGIVLLVAVGRGMYDLQVPEATLAIIPAVMLGAFSFFAVGFVLAGVMPTARSAQAVGMALFYPMLFLSGAAIPRQLMPETVQRIAEFLPLTHVVIILEDLWFLGKWNMVSLAVVGGILVVCLLVSRRTFRWE